jgi:malate synthase
MHGSKEVAFANETIDRVEDMLGLERNTMKINKSVRHHSLSSL